MESNCCKGVFGVLILVAGILLLLAGLGKMEEMPAHLWSGILFGITGLGMLLHAGGMCPKCK